jgi:hypothetical protein
MRARTITTIVVLGALAIPVSASARVDSDYHAQSTPNAITGGSSDSSQPAGSSDYSSVNSITGGSSQSGQPTGSSDYSSVSSITGGSGESSQPVGSQDVSSGYSSLNAITGTPSSEPTLVSGSPASLDDGFDWLSGAIGAAAAMALVALGGAAFLTVRRRTAVAPSPASTS